MLKNIINSDRNRNRYYAILLLGLAINFLVSCSRQQKPPEQISSSPSSSPVEKIPTPLPLELQPLPENSPTPAPKITEKPLTKPSPIPSLPSLESSPKVTTFKSQSSEEIFKYLDQQKTNLNICDGAIDDNVSKDSSSVYQLKDGRYLVELLCFLGAYQGNYEYFIYSLTDTGAELKPLTLVRFEEDENGKLAKTQANSVGGLPDYNSEKQSLKIFSKGRGLSDCGSLAEYKLVDSQLELIEYRYKEECDGNYTDPEKYPKIYP